MKEGIDYDLVPVDDAKNKQAWDVRFLTGIFNETVIRYGNIAFEEDCLKFNFVIQSSPDGDLDEDNIDLQNFAADILESILETASEDGSLLTKDSNEN